MNFDEILSKPYLVGVYDWTTTQVENDTVATVTIPYGVLVNEQLKAPFRIAAKYRLKACAFLQLTGTPMHQGMLIAAAVPPGSCSTAVAPCRNTYLQAPHAFLSANEATPVCVEIPFYSNTKVRNTNLTSKSPIYDPYVNYANLEVSVFNRLYTGTGGSATLSLSVHIMFTEAEFYVPKNQDTTFNPQSKMVTNMLDFVTFKGKEIVGDYIDQARKTIKTYTGLHNPNVATIQEKMVPVPRNITNSVDVPTYFEKLDPYAGHQRNTVEPTFYTKNDEMLVKNIINKPQYIATFAVPGTSPTGTMLFCRPITPYQKTMSVSDFYNDVPLQTLSWMSRYWKGTIKLHIQSVMSNFHNVRLMVARNYSNDPATLNGVPAFLDNVSLQTTTLEFAGGSQVQTIDLEYCADLEQLPTTINPVTNALSHGMYYIYLAQPLVKSGTVNDNVYFNVYISAGDDFEFYGYSTYRMDMFRQGLNPVGEEDEFEAQSIMVEPSSQLDLSNELRRNEIPDDDKNFQPITSMRDYIRRFVPVKIDNLGANADPSSVNFISTIPVISLFNRFAGNGKNFQRIARAFYHGHTGGLKFKIYVYGVQDAGVRYVPPAFCFDYSSIPNRIMATDAQPTALANFVKWYGAIDYPYVNPTTGPGAIEGDYAPQPYLEMGQHHVPLTNYVLSAGTPPLAGTARLSMCVLEFEIPNMNALEFIGDSTWRTNQNTSKTVTASNALGDIIIYGLRRDVNDIVIPTGGPYYVVHMAYADECRMGFNVYAPRVCPVTPDTAAPLNSTDSEYIPNFVTPSNVPTPLNYEAQAPKAYVG